MLDDYTPLRHADAEKLQDDQFHVFPIRRALWYVQADSLGGRYGFQGDSFYSASNPPYGATFTYFNGQEIETLKQKRKAAEKKAGDADVPTPDWDDLRQEELEDAAQIVFVIRDSSDTVVSRVTGSSGKGIHRLTWDFRCSALVATGAPLCAPGTYSLEPMLVSADASESLAEPVSFEVESIVDSALPAQDRGEVLAFLQDVSKSANTAAALRGKLSKRIEELNSVQTMLARTAMATQEQTAKARELELRLQEFDLAINGDATKRYYAVESEPTVSSRINSVLFSASNSTHGPTETHRQQYQIATEQLAEVIAEFSDFVESDLEPFQESLDEAGLPWTTGRAIPGIR